MCDLDQRIRCRRQLGTIVPRIGPAQIVGGARCEQGHSERLPGRRRRGSRRGRRGSGRGRRGSGRGRRGRGRRGSRRAVVAISACGGDECEGKDYGQRFQQTIVFHLSSIGLVGPFSRVVMY